MLETFVFKRHTKSGKEATIAGIKGDLYSEDLASGGGDTDHFIDVFAALSTPGMVCVDIGANIGTTTSLMATMQPQSTIVSIEPSVSAFSALEQTASLNQGPQYHLLRMGAGDKEEVANFVQDGASVAASFFNSDLPGSDAIRIRPLDAVVEDLGLARLDFVKIDVEGFEPRVLDGMKRVTEAMKPVVYMEFNSWALASNSVAHMPFLQQLISEYGFFVYRDRATGMPVFVKTVGETRTFLHDNMIRNGCVDDIVFSLDGEKIRNLAGKMDHPGSPLRHPMMVGLPPEKWSSLK